MADEAHRTQYGFEAKLKTRKAALKPNRRLKPGRRPTTSGRPRPDSRLCAAQPRLRRPKYTNPHYQAGYAQHLRDALPNATFVAFTGTPVSSTDRDTRAVFGDYIHVYDMQQAKEDGATVAIYYESRLAKLQAEGRRPALHRRRGGRAGRGRRRKHPGAAQKPLGRAGEGGGRRAPRGQRGGRPGGAL
jgi:type I restriction enzyme R subunit